MFQILDVLSPPSVIEGIKLFPTTAIILVAAVIVVAAVAIVFAARKPRRNRSDREDE